MNLREFFINKNKIFFGTNEKKVPLQLWDTGYIGFKNAEIENTPYKHILYTSTPVVP